MAFLLSAFGLPGQILGGLLGSHHSGHAPVAQHKSAGPGASFGSILNGQMAAGSADPMQKLTDLVQKGMPISSIVDRLAGQVANAVGRQLPSFRGGASHAQLVNSIKAALEPPSNAPPGADAAQQVAALADRLQRWMTGVAREADQRVGQQSESSGQVLDARTARELPAQQDPDHPSASLDVSALAGSLLSQVAASFTSQPGALSGASQPGAAPLLGSSATPTAPLVPTAPLDGRAMASATSFSAKDAVSQFSSLARTQTSIATTPGKDAEADAIAATTTPSQIPGTPAQPATAQQAAPQTQAPDTQQQRPLLPHGYAAPPATSPTPPQANPADLLARMLIRAAGLDARVNSGASPAMAMVPVRTGAGSSSAWSPSSLGSIGRMSALLTQAVNAASTATNGDAAGGNAGNGLARDGKATFANDASSFAPVTVAANNAPSNATFAQQAAAAGAQTPVNAHDVVEQVVKGMAMRSAADGTSEVRLRLQPETLGTVTMKLIVNGDSVSATALAQNADVRATLLAHQHHLTRSLADAGLKLTSFNVDVSGRDAGSQDRNRDGTSGFGRHYTVHEVARAGGPDATSESTPSGPALVPHQTLALFNYLA